jgi:periplasmic divalent cation tolerance protein
LLIKTPVRRKADLMKWLSDTHPYETPEIIALPVLDVSSAYLAWAESATQGDEAS